MSESAIPSLTVFRPVTVRGTAVGAGFVGISLLLSAALFYKGLTSSTGFHQLGPLIGGTVFILLAGLYGYWTWSCRSLSYIVDRNALSICWGGLRQIIPLTNIERLIPGTESENPRIEGVNWMGHHVGKGQVEELGDVLFYSAHSVMTDVLYVQTAGETYGISLPDHVAFAQVVQANQARGSLFEQKQAVHRWGIAAQSFWQDSKAQVLAALLLVSFFVVLGYVLHIYPSLAQTVPLRYPALGGIVRVADKSALLDIPRSAAGFLALDLVLAVLLHNWERMIGYILLLAGIGVQITLLVAAIFAVA